MQEVNDLNIRTSKKSGSCNFRRKIQLEIGETPSCQTSKNDTVSTLERFRRISRYRESTPKSSTLGESIYECPPSEVKFSEIKRRVSKRVFDKDVLREELLIQKLSDQVKDIHKTISSITVDIIVTLRNTELGESR